MLRKVSINSAVYSASYQILQELIFSWEQLENTVHQLVPQKFNNAAMAIVELSTSTATYNSVEIYADICPQQKKSTSFCFNVKPEQRILLLTVDKTLVKIWLILSNSLALLLTTKEQLSVQLYLE